MTLAKSLDACAKINELQPSAGDLDDLQVLPFFSSAIIADLKKELSAANGTSVDADKLECWKNHSVQLPFGLLVIRPFFYFNLLLQLLSGYFLYFQTVVRRTNKMH